MKQPRTVIAGAGETLRRSGRSRVADQHAVLNTEEMALDSEGERAAIDYLCSIPKQGFDMRTQS